MAPRKFSDFVEMARRDPFPWPMPGDEVLMIAQPSISAETAAVKAANEAGTMLEAIFAGLVVYAGDENGQKIADAYAQVPASMLQAVMDEMREHFSAQKPEDA